MFFLFYVVSGQDIRLWVGFRFFFWGGGGGANSQATPRSLEKSSNSPLKFSFLTKIETSIQNSKKFSPTLPFVFVDIQNLKKD